MATTSTLSARPTESGSGELRPVSGSTSLRTYFVQMWRMRGFLRAMSGEEVRGQFGDSVLGSFWLLINPLIMSAIYLLVFGVLFGARGDFENYIGFLIVGLLTFTYSRRAVTAASKCLRQNVNLIQSVRFPRAVIPLSVVVTSLITHGPAIVVMLLVVLLTGEGVDVKWLLIPAALALQTVFNVGLALFTARLGFHFADTQQVVPHVMRLALYLSGVMYGLERIAGKGPAWLEWVFVHNPFWVYISLFRDALLHDDALGPGRWRLALIWAVVSVVLGFAFFRGREEDYAHV